ncbi:MAG TPA: IS30 family transposase [Candidatus Saccharimonadales bacterium]|nr:IS30 family transposase [Candidatus Saccharimonadales bacterium]
MQKRKKLTEEERDRIATLYAQRIGVREIGKLLERNHTTISRELKRNRFGQSYNAIHAQRRAEERKSDAGKRQPLKGSKIYSYVLEKLKEGWSPEQIAGRLELEQEKKIICHETIYRFIYTKALKEDRLWEYLPRKQKHRRKKYGRKSQRIRIPQRVSIHERPDEINNRLVLGHWEGDTVEGKGHKDGIHTEVERVSRFLLAKKVSSITSEATINVQKDMFTRLPEKLRLSTTLDNGKENHLHYELKELEMKTYFADPYSSWQRGTNENTNGLVRRYLPKKTSFTNLTQEELDDIVSEINNRPRKVLQYKKPIEILSGAFQFRM